MDDKVRYTAYRYFYTRTNAGLVGEFGNAAFDPAFMAVEEIRTSRSGRPGGTVMRRPTCRLARCAASAFLAREVLVDTQRQFPPGDRVNALAS